MPSFPLPFQILVLCGNFHDLVRRILAQAKQDKAP